MTTLVPDDHHPALDAPEQDRVDYLRVVASMAFADRDADESELSRVREMCEALALGEESKERVLAAAREPEGVDHDAILARLAGSDLRFAVLVDAIDIACADQEITPEEAEEIDHLAEALKIDAGQKGMIQRYVMHERGLDRETISDEEMSRKLAAAGVPAATLALATVAGAPIAAGLGLAAALGVGSYGAVRWLYRKAKRA